MELKLYDTTSSKLNTLETIGGQVIVSKDDACLYIDMDSVGRLKITDWVELKTDNDRLAVLAPIAGKIYYVVETNAIWKYIEGKWKYLNEVNKEELLQYVLENLVISETNNGNAIEFWTGTKAEYDAITNRNPNCLYVVTDESDNIIQHQVTPLFANSIEECTDTTKLYVLPDGNIYAYMLTESEGGIAYTNQIPISKDTDGSVYNAVGYMENMYLSEGEPKARDGIDCSGFIPIGAGSSHTASGEWVIRMSGITATQATAFRFAFYDANKTFITQFYGTNIPNSNWGGSGSGDGSVQIPCELDGSGNITMFDITKITGYIAHETQKGIPAFMRICCPNIDENSILTVNEEIKEAGATTGYAWTNTGHAFIPADYEDRIVGLENEVAKLETEVAKLKAGGTASDCEGYVVEEAERVAKQVYSRQNANTVSFLAISDMHYHLTNTNIIASNVHAGQGMDIVRKNVNIDFAVCLGDNGWGSGVENDTNRATIEKGIKEIRSANACIDSAFRGIPNFRAVGNHCSLVYNYAFNNNDYLDESELFPLYGAYNRGAVFPNGEKDRGYCYRDFDEFKLRVICMNTTDIKGLNPANGTTSYVSGTQMKWFAETIDLSSKSDVSEWSILILSHIPLDYSTSTQCVNILKAYVDGTSVSFTKDGISIAHNYSGKNGATIIGNVHGHNHCFLVDYLRTHDGDGTTTPTTIKRICIPNACFDRTNERGENDTADMWDIEYGEETSYEKTAGTAKDTSFCVLTIDLATKVIYADHYGAGYDREIGY